MAKKESTFVNMVATLVLIAASAGLALSGVRMLTADAIALAKRAKLERALKAVLPEFDNDIGSDTLVVRVTEKDHLTFYFARKGDELVGTAVETFTNMGFSGQIKIMVGFAPDGTIINTAVIHHMETPGLGDKIEASKSVWSQKNFNGLDPSTVTLKVKKDNGDIDGITAATITARAFCDAVQRAYDAYLNVRGDNE